MTDHELLIDEVLHGHGDLAPEEERKYRICGAYDCVKLLPANAYRHRKFCDLTCAQRHRRNMRLRRTPLTRRCKWCRVTFIPKPNQIYHSQECVRACANRRSKRWRAANRTKARESAVEYARYVRKSRSRKWRKPRPCRFCGREFLPQHPNEFYCPINRGATTGCKYEAQKARMRDRYKNDPEYRAYKHAMKRRAA